MRDRGSVRVEVIEWGVRCKGSQTSLLLLDPDPRVVQFGTELFGFDETPGYTTFTHDLGDLRGTTRTGHCPGGVGESGHVSPLVTGVLPKSRPPFQSDVDS